MALAEPPRHVPGQILVRTKPQADETQLEARIQARGGIHSRTLRDRLTRVVHVPPTQWAKLLNELANDPDVEFAEPDYIATSAFVPNDPFVASEEAWHLTRIQAPGAWDFMMGKPQVVAAVLDSGVNPAHPDLAGRLLPGHDFVFGDDDPADDFGHGTAVTGAIVAAGNNGQGTAGVAFGCRVLPVKVMNSSGYATYSAIADGIHFAVENGARVINISIAGSSPSATLQSAVDFAWGSNVVVVAAAGNNANSLPQYPAACNNVLSIAATDSADRLATFSSYGNHVRLCAPGENIWTTQRNLDNPYGAWRGTSFSSPIVAGIVALAVSINPTLTAAQLTQLLEQTADDLGPVGYDGVYANGRVNAARAVLVAASLPGAESGLPALTPFVALTSPGRTDAFVAGDWIHLAADAFSSDPGGQISSVEFYANDVRLVTLVPSPYAFDWQPTQPGNFILTAVATDDEGLRATSAPVAITVLSPETVPPSVQITSAPKSGARLTEELLTLSGTASDNEEIARVELGLNNAPYATVEGTSNWTTPITLSPGLNVIRIRSVDRTGNVSSVVELNYTFVKLAMLVVQTEGDGSVGPNLNGTLLEVGRLYTLKARPGRNQVFNRWEGIDSTSPELSFAMEEGLTLVAHFMPSPFLPLQGTFTGLLQSSAGVTPDSAGSFAVRVTRSGKFSGKMVMGGVRQSFRGQFDASGRADLQIAHATSSSLDLNLQVDLNGSEQITGSLNNGSWAAEISGDRNVFSSRSNPAPQAGKGSFVLEREGESSDVAGGFSKVSRSGKARVAGKLMDGRKFLSAAALARNGDFPLYLPLDKGNEAVIGWLNFPENPIASATGTVLWVRSGTNGFASTLQAASFPILK